MAKPNLITVAVLAALLSGCNDGGYRLYRTFVTDSAQREYVATFNADSGGEFDQVNCEAAAQLFQQSRGLAHWCERVGD